MDSKKQTSQEQPPVSKFSVTSENELETLKQNGKWASIIALLTFMYGNMTVARQLPPDPRQKSWLMMQSPYPNLIISLLYVYAVTVWGPRYMSKQKPVAGLRPYMMIYNAFQVVFSAYLFLEGGFAGWFTEYNWVCQKCDFSENTNAIRMMNVGYWYLISKFIDFIDTAFFVLNKKTEHISLLHVSHHALMPVGLWFGVHFQPGGHSTLMGLLNSFVHTVMYLYYLLAAMGPRVRPFLWWKKYLTTLQMAQFTIVFFHALSLAFVECDVPVAPALVRWLCGQAVIFFVLFADFYAKAYRSKDRTKVNGKSNGFAKVSEDNGWGAGEKDGAAGANHKSLAAPFTCVPSGFQDVITERKHTYN
ncbi:elongation of very long chain fatty acids protein-like [Portunus trituberculatus]|uniref:elongation of very long chain fatty acids protein-like n=1 Tax=Portunus trituberculatus TaxID=210409 RepID=UPI001E1CFDEA|nr:elongation of very long chain fatty acids protein-like [Portunus trituberculatus]XP_045112078.1 elongation of very long chain fatty acids protein-like [Portunus trituberculatus]